MKKTMMMAALMAVLTAAPAAAQPAQPSARMCPPATGDLDYLLNVTMTKSGFYERPLGWQKPIDGTLGNDMLFGPDRSLLLNFDRFRMSDGSVVLTARIEIANPRGHMPFDNAGVAKVFQQALDEIAQVFPCK